MTVVVTLTDYRPSPRYDSLPWTQAQIQEAALSTGTWATLETQNLTPVDADPRNPAYRNFTTVLGTTTEQWYRIVFLDAAAHTGLPTVPIQNVEDDRPVYFSVAELAAHLRVSASDRHDSLMRVLKSAAEEIDHEIGPTDKFGETLPYSNPPSMVREVNFQRAYFQWKQEQSQGGIILLGQEETVAYTARDSWDRYAHLLAPFKGDWAIA